MSYNVSITEDELSVLLNALSVAKDKFRDNQKVIGEADGENLGKLHDQFVSLSLQFEKQAKDCDKLFFKLSELEG